MSHKVKVWVDVEKKGLFGPKIVKEKRTIVVDDATYKQMKKEAKRQQSNREWEDAFWFDLFEELDEEEGF